MIINVLIPAIVMLLMIVVGTGLQVGQFSSVLHNKAALVGGSAQQKLTNPGESKKMYAMVRTGVAIMTRRKFAPGRVCRPRPGIVRVRLQQALGSLG